MARHASERIEVYTNGWFKPKYTEKLLCKRDSDLSVTEPNIEPNIEPLKSKASNSLFSQSAKSPIWVFMHVPRSVGRQFELHILPKENRIDAISIPIDALANERPIKSLDKSMFSQVSTKIGRIKALEKGKMDGYGPL